MNHENNNENELRKENEMGTMVKTKTRAFILDEKNQGTFFEKKSNLKKILERSAKYKAKEGVIVPTKYDEL